MEKFTRLTAKACPLMLANVNTDQLLPARFLKWPRSRGLGAALLRDLRFDADDKPLPDFPLNDPRWSGAKILLAGRNFGGGSSREAAVYALYDYGFRCVVAASFGDIFSQNAVKNGLLAAVIAESDVEQLAAAANAKPQQTLTVDLETQTIRCATRTYRFAIDPVSRNQLINGWDDVDLTDSYRDKILAYRANNLIFRPWAAPRSN